MMQSVRTFLDLIRVEHTVFALPFAYVGMFLGAGGAPSAAQLLWVTVAMVAARSAGMSLNRLIDREIDARNPRTAARPLQAGRISARATALGAVLALLTLGFAAWQLNVVVFALWPGALAFLVGYPYTKRLTWLSHFILGFTDGLAPMGAWVAVTGSFWLRSDLPAWLLLAALTVWIGGFDLIYACQDVDVDREQGLHPFRRASVSAPRCGWHAAATPSRWRCLPAWGCGSAWAGLSGSGCCWWPRFSYGSTRWCGPTTSRASTSPFST